MITYKWMCYSVRVIVIRNAHSITSSILLWDCISHSANTFGKGMNTIILTPAMEVYAIEEQIGLFSLG